MSPGEDNICGPLLYPTDQVAVEGNLLDVRQLVEEDVDDDEVLEDELKDHVGPPAAEDDGVVLQEVVQLPEHTNLTQSSSFLRVMMYFKGKSNKEKAKM